MQHQQRLRSIPIAFVVDAVASDNCAHAVLVMLVEDVAAVADRLGHRSAPASVFSFSTASDRRKRRRVSSKKCSSIFWRSSPWYPASSTAVTVANNAPRTMDEPSIV